MADRYWIGGTQWSNTGSWSANISGIPSGATPPTSPDDTAYFSATGVSTSQAIDTESNAYGPFAIDVLGTQTGTVFINGDQLNALGYYARAGAGELVIATITTLMNSGVTNESSNPIRFLFSVTPSFTPTLVASGAGDINFEGGIDLASVGNPDFRYITVNSAGTGVTTFASIANASGGFGAAGLIVSAGTAAVTTAGSTTVQVASGATIRLGTGTQTGAISGPGTLRKTTGGTLTLLGANTYGPTIIDAGTIKAGTTTTIPSAITVGASGTLQTATSGAAGKLALAGTLTINGGTLRIGG